LIAITKSSTILNFYLTVWGTRFYKYLNILPLYLHALTFQANFTYLSAADFISVVALVLFCSKTFRLSVFIKFIYCCASPKRRLYLTHQVKHFFIDYYGSDIVLTIELIEDTLTENGSKLIQIIMWLKLLPKLSLIFLIFWSMIDFIFLFIIV
jgi:hypothetical protein